MFSRTVLANSILKQSCIHGKGSSPAFFCTKSNQKNNELNMASAYKELETRVNQNNVNNVIYTNSIEKRVEELEHLIKEKKPVVTGLKSKSIKCFNYLNDHSLKTLSAVAVILFFTIYIASDFMSRREENNKDLLSLKN